MCKPKETLNTKKINIFKSIIFYTLNHCCQDIKLALCQMIGQSAAGQGHEIFNLTEKELLYKQKIGMELLEVANIISPGISR